MIGSHFCWWNRRRAASCACASAEHLASPLLCFLQSNSESAKPSNGRAAPVSSTLLPSARMRPRRSDRPRRQAPGRHGLCSLLSLSGYRPSQLGPSSQSRPGLGKAKPVTWPQFGPSPVKGGAPSPIHFSFFLFSVATPSFQNSP